MSDIKITKGSTNVKIYDFGHIHCVWLYVPDSKFLIYNKKLKGSNVTGQGGLKHLPKNWILV